MADAISLEEIVCLVSVRGGPCVQCAGGMMSHKNRAPFVHGNPVSGGWVHAFSKDVGCFSTFQNPVRLVGMP